MDLKPAGTTAGAGPRKGSSDERWDGGREWATARQLRRRQSGRPRDVRRALRSAVAVDGEHEQRAGQEGAGERVRRRRESPVRPGSGRPAGLVESFEREAAGDRAADARVGEIRAVGLLERALEAMPAQ